MYTDIKKREKILNKFPVIAGIITPLLQGEASLYFFFGPDGQISWLQQTWHPKRKEFFISSSGPGDIKMQDQWKPNYRVVLAR
jgi:hypothetical protein